MPSLILGLVGSAGSGKGTVARYLKENYAASTHTFSASMRDVLRRILVQETRDNLITVSEVLRQAFGEDVFAHVIVKEVSESPADIVVVEGIRRHQDYETLSRIPHFVLVAIEVTPEVRFARMKARGQNTDEADMKWEDFQRISARTTEVSLLEVMRNAKEHLHNDGTPAELFAHVEALLKRLQKYV